MAMKMDIPVYILTFLRNKCPPPSPEGLHIINLINTMLTDANRSRGHWRSVG